MIERIGEATLYLGDCRDVLPTLGRVGAIVTDPPYGIDFASNRVARTTTAPWVRTVIANDGDLAARDFVLEWHSGAWAVFGTLKRPAPAGTRGVLVWDKGPASGMGDLTFPWKPSFEVVFIGGDGWSGARDEAVLKDHWVVTRASMGRVHPNEKPVSVLEHIIAKAPGVILDPFMGSGSTGVACVKRGRKFIGVEVDPHYFNISCKRIQEAYRQPDLFVESPAPKPEQLSFLGAAE